MTNNDVLSLTIKDRSVLYSSYMKFLPNGGLFIPTTRSYDLGDKVLMLLKLFGSEQKHPIEGRVVWLTPEGSQGNKVVGIGVEFSDQHAHIKTLIEASLGAQLDSDRMTFTM